MATNPKVQKAVNIATIAGASILVIGGAYQMTKAKGVKDFLFPALSILVGVSAFRYAMSHQKAVEKTSSAAGIGVRGATNKVGSQVPCNQGGTYCSDPNRECRNGMCI